MGQRPRGGPQAEPLEPEGANDQRGDDKAGECARRRLHAAPGNAAGGVNPIDPTLRRSLRADTPSIVHAAPDSSVGGEASIAIAARTSPVRSQNGSMMRIIMKVFAPMA